MYQISKLPPPLIGVASVFRSKMKKFLLGALLMPAVALGQTYPSPTFNSITLQTPIPLASGGTGANTATGATSAIQYLQGSTGSTARSVTSKLQGLPVDIEDFGGADDGITDDTNALAAALAAACPKNPVRYRNKIYIASSVTVPAGCTLQGPLNNATGVVSGGNFNTAGTLLLNSAATINLSTGATLQGMYILNSALANSLPFANATVAQTAVTAFSGTAVTAQGDDVQLRDMWIGGFAQALYSTAHSRTKIQRLQLDNTNGIWIDNSYDIARVSDVHAWPFLTTTVSVFRRQGSAYKLTGHYDTGYLQNCFEYGYDVGFDIQSNNEVALVNDYSDGSSLQAGVGQIGFKFTGNSELINVTGGGVSGKDTGMYTNVTSSGNGAISVNGTHFWGNRVHLEAAQHKVLNVTGAYFRDTSGGNNTAVQIDSSMTGITSISDSVIDSSGVAFSIAAGAPTYLTRISNMTYRGTTATQPNVFVADNANVNLGFYAYGTSGVSPVLNFYQAAGSATTPTVSPNGAQVAQIIANVYDGTQFANIAKIRASAAATPASGSTPGQWIFSTTPAGSETPVDRVIINPSGNFFPITDNSIALGGSTNRWTNVYGVNGVFTSVTVGGMAVTPTLSGTTGSIGGSALAAGACASGTVAVANSTTAMAVDASPVTYPGDGIFWRGYVSASGTVTVKVCASVAATPTASAYNVRVLQ